MLPSSIRVRKHGKRSHRRRRARSRRPPIGPGLLHRCLASIGTAGPILLIPNCKGQPYWLRRLSECPCISASPEESPGICLYGGLVPVLPRFTRVDVIIAKAARVFRGGASGSELDRSRRAETEIPRPAAEHVPEYRRLAPVEVTRQVEALPRARQSSRDSRTSTAVRPISRLRHRRSTVCPQMEARC